MILDNHRIISDERVLELDSMLDRFMLELIKQGKDGTMTNYEFMQEFIKSHPNLEIIEYCHVSITMFRLFIEVQADKVRQQLFHNMSDIFG